MPLDFATQGTQDTFTFQLLGADDEPLFAGKDEATGEPTLPVKVTVYGPGSKQYQRSASRMQNRAIERVKKRGKATSQSAEEKLKEQAEHLADITAGFENATYQGLTGREMAVAMYSNPALGYIAAQVNKQADDWANFTKGSSTT